MGIGRDAPTTIGRRRFVAAMWTVVTSSCRRRRAFAPPPSPLVDDPAPALTPVDRDEWRRWIGEAAEPPAPELADNFISNETSALVVADALVSRRGAGRFYVGVGPEQNFSYLALARPDLAFVVDHRRGNFVLHVFYKALFELAAGRGDFLAMLLGRAPQPPHDPRASIDEVLAHVSRVAPSRAAFDAVGAEVERTIDGYGLDLDDHDRALLREAREVLFVRQLDGRPDRYVAPGSPPPPPLRAILRLRDREGRFRGFLAREDAFRFVQAMHRCDRIVPVVGDFAGARAYVTIGHIAKARGLTLGCLYASNVEQFLERAGWASWVANARTLPTDERSLFVRSRLGAHPRRWPGHATATFAQPISSLDLAPDAWAIATSPALA